MPFKRFGAWLATGFGCLGVIACLLGIYAVWLVGAQLDRANDRVFAAVDKGLAAARDRVLGVQQRLQESRLSTEEIGKLLQDWAKMQAAERIASRLEIEGKTANLARQLGLADLWLETASESLQVARQILETASSVGAPVDAAAVDEVLAKLASLRSRLQEARTTVEGVRELTARIDDVASAQERISRAMRLAARAILTIGESDTRLGELAEQLSELQASAGRLKATTSGRIVCAMGAGVVLFAWMGAGQITLCLCGWKTCRRRRG